MAMRIPAGMPKIVAVAPRAVMMAAIHAPIAAIIRPKNTWIADDTSLRALLIPSVNWVLTFCRAVFCSGAFCLYWSAAEPFQLSSTAREPTSASATRALTGEPTLELHWSALLETVLGSPRLLRISTSGSKNSLILPMRPFHRSRILSASQPRPHGTQSRTSLMASWRSCTRPLNLLTRSRMSFAVPDMSSPLRVGQSVGMGGWDGVSRWAPRRPGTAARRCPRSARSCA